MARGFGGGFGLESVGSLRHVTTRIRFEDLDRRPIVVPDGDIHHRNETLLGPGDPWLMAVTGRRMGAWSAAVRGGVTIPLGRTEENPFELGRRGLPHQHIQFGTGTWDPLAAAGRGRRGAPLRRGDDERQRPGAPARLRERARLPGGPPARGHDERRPPDRRAVARAGRPRLRARDGGDVERAHRGGRQPRAQRPAAVRGHRAVLRGPRLDPHREGAPSDAVQRRADRLPRHRRPRLAVQRTRKTSHGDTETRRTGTRKRRRSGTGHTAARSAMRPPIARAADS